MPISAIFKKFKQFFQIANLLSRKSQAVERFQFPWAIILFETQAGIKMPRLPILEKKKDLFKDNIYFSKQTKYSIVLRIPKQYESLTRNLDEKSQIVLLKSFKDFFLKKRHVFLKKIWSFELLEIAWAIITSGKHSEGKYPWLVFLKTFKYSFEKKYLSPQKTQVFERLQNTWPTVNFETYLEKELAKLSVFESFKTFFFQVIYLFFQKKPNSESFEISRAVNTFGTYSTWN